MARSTPRWLTSRNMLTASVLLLVVLSLVPPRVGHMLDWVHQPAVTVLSPIQYTVHRGVNVLRGPENPDAGKGEVDRAVHEQLKFELGQVRDENEALKRVVVDLQQGRAINLSMEVRQFVAPVIGPSPDASGGHLAVKAGKRDGVEVNSVVVAHGVHLVGRVTDAADRSCSVLPITIPTRESGRGRVAISGIIMLDALRPGPACPNLEPTGRGTLRGFAEDFLDPQTQAQPELAAGMTVRLKDTNWPQSAQQLVIGEIESVEPDKSSPLRRIVTVRPVFRLDRLSEVSIRVPIEPAASGTTGGTP